MRVAGFLTDGKAKRKTLRGLAGIRAVLDNQRLAVGILGLGFVQAAPYKAPGRGQNLFGFAHVAFAPKTFRACVVVSVTNLAAPRGREL